MRSELLVLAISATLVGCTSERPPDTDPDSDTEVDSDTDTDTTVVEPCGNGAPDPGEQCDDGDANGPDASCSDSCQFNGFVTCDMLSSGVITLDTSVAQPDGTFHLAGRFDEVGVALTSSCVADPVASIAVQFALPADGAYLVSTANARDTSNTSISLRTDCDDRAEIECGANNAGVAGASQAFVIDGVAGEVYVALIEVIDGEAGGWHLSVSPIDGVADPDEACDAATRCVSGSICADGTCVVQAAPVITGSSITQTDSYEYTVTLTGTDPNRDVVGMLIPGFTDILGDVWGDEAIETPLVVDSPHITWDGDAFTARWLQDPYPLGTGLSDFDSLTVTVVDRAGATAEVVTLQWPDAIDNVSMPYIGDACDTCEGTGCQGNTSGFPRYCDPNPHADPNDPDANEIVGLVCRWDEGFTASTCQDRNVNAPPVITDGEMWWEGPTAMIRVEGTDTEHHSGMSAELVAVTTGGAEIPLDAPFLGDSSWDRGAFTVSGAFDAAAAEGEAIDHIDVWLTDNGYPSATTEAPYAVTWVAPVAPIAAGEGEACDLRGWEAACEAPWVCSPSLSGVPGCAASEAPTLLSASGLYQGGFFPSMTISFEAEDENADWYALMAESTTGNPRELVWDGFDGAWAPSPFGAQTYAGETMIGFGNWIYNLWLVDADGNASDSTVILGVPTQARGAECGTGICSFFGCSPPIEYCDVAAGDTCSSREETEGLVTVCEENVAPTLSSVVVHRVSSTKYQVEIVGADPNGDASDVAVIQTEDGVSAPAQVTVDFLAPLYGQTEIISSFTGDIANPEAEVELEIQLQDFGFLDSEILTVPVPPILLAGETCTGDDTVGRCWEGSECISGTCFAYEPQLSGVELTYKNNDRDAVFTVVGFDDQTGSAMQIETATIEVAGQTFTKTLFSSQVTWDGNEFRFNVDAAGLGTGALVGQTFVRATVTDVGGFSDSGLFFIEPTARGLDESCDPAGEDDACHAGLACDAGTCANDAADTCAGTELIEATGATMTVNTASGTNREVFADYASCGAENQPRGKEKVVRYTATQAGTLVITTADDPTDGTVHPGYLFVRFDECVNPDAIVACSNLSGSGNTVRVEVETGDTLYVMLDGPSFPSGGPMQLSFAYE